MAEQYRQQIGEKLNHITLTEEHNGGKLWEKSKTIINSVDEEVLGIMKPANKGTNFYAKCPADTEDKNKAYRKIQQSYGTRNLTEENNEKRRKEKLSL